MKINRYVVLILLVLCGMVSCTDNHQRNSIKRNNIEALLMKAKYCSTYYPEYQQDGFHIYFAGRLINNTSDTIYIPNKDKSIDYHYNTIPIESLFYSLIDDDTIYFETYGMPPYIMPKSSTIIELHKYITPEEHSLMNKFRDIFIDQQILDTIKIGYNMPTEETHYEILSNLIFVKSSKYTIEKLPYNTFFEGIFKESDFYDSLVITKEPLISK